MTNTSPKVGGQAWNGLLLVNKPRGMVSKDVSRWLQRRLGKLKLGHVGTLDPMAEGVLPILLGNATRLQDYLLASRKSYEFEIRFGFRTDSMDLDGNVLERSDAPPPSAEALAAAAAALEGTPTLAVPLHSAVKLNGKPLYEYAREGRGDRVDEAALSRAMQVHSLRLLAHKGDSAVFAVTCGKGTYVRSLATALCEATGTLGTVVTLIRSETAGFRLEQTHGLDAIEARLAAFEELLIPTHAIPMTLPRWSADQEQAARLRQGQRLSLPREIFLRNLHNAEEIDGLGEYDSLLLLDERREILGIGCTNLRPDDDRMIISMRRALS